MIRQDLRHAIRVLTANPGFTAVAVLSLALGIGANTAIFSLLNSVLLSTLPVQDPQALVMLTDPRVSGVSVGVEGGDRSLLTYQEFRQLQEQTETFASLMASQSSLTRTEARIDGGEPEDVALRLVSASYFPTLGVPPLLGRTFDAAREPRRGIVRRLRCSATTSGSAASADAPTCSARPSPFAAVSSPVIGVMPSSFFGETVGERPDAWVPLAMQPAAMPGRPWLHDDPGNVEKVMWLHVFGRLTPGVPLERAQANANVVFHAGAGDVLRVAGGRGHAEALPRSAAGAAARRDRRVLAAQRLRRAAAGAARRRRARAAHRLLEPRQPAAGADDGAEPRDGGAPGARRQPRPPGPAAADREPVPRGARRRHRRWPGVPAARRPAAARLRHRHCAARRRSTSACWRSSSC